ncbi:sugar kinase [Thermoactinomyces mirandus]|uniref:Sugar kinase n=1 Tax=Thermoactinomyces mirandus TaxID=2756294 RepID=A0A7W2AQY1_9BACL|nr:sugar kinase [Thermoactinomyces mirandus]MBA4600996.1 sugar kinase [Thermoactinomyces mirandus]
MARVVTLGEVLLRLSPPGQTRLLGARQFEIHYGGSELNVAAALSGFGIHCTAVTKVPEHELGYSAIKELASFGIDTSFIAKGGDRIGIYYLENGYSVRPAKVVYDRKDSAFSRVSPDEFNIEQILAGADLFHVSGITLGVSENAFQLAKAFMQKARKSGVKVSFDFNYRSKLWSIGEAMEKFREVLPWVDILFGSHFDFCHVLGKKPVNSLDETDILQYYRSLYEAMFEQYHPKYMISSIREVESANRNRYQGLLYHNHRIERSRKYTLDIVDRVGTGDAFAAGFLYACLMNREPSYAIDFAAASTAFKHTVPGDVMIARACEIEQLIATGSCTVQR